MGLSRRTLIACLAAATALGAAIAVVWARANAPVWCLADAHGAPTTFVTVPDGEPVPHAAAMWAPDGSWAYLYPVPSRIREILERFDVGDSGVTYLVPTGTVVTTTTGRWREYRRCGDDEFAEVLAESSRRDHSGM